MSLKTNNNQNLNTTRRRRRRTKPNTCVNLRQQFQDKTICDIRRDIQTKVINVFKKKKDDFSITNNNIDIDGEDKLIIEEDKEDKEDKLIFEEDKEEDKEDKEDKLIFEEDKEDKLIFEEDKEDIINIKDNTDYSKEKSNLIEETIIDKSNVVTFDYIENDNIENTYIIL